MARQELWENKHIYITKIGNKSNLCHFSLGQVLNITSTAVQLQFIAFRIHLSYLAAYTGLSPDTFHTIFNLEWRKGRLYGFSRRHLRRRRHGVDCGISSSRLALSLVFRELSSEASLPLSTLSSEDTGRSGSFAMHKHPSPGIVSTTGWCYYSPAGFFPILDRKLRCTATIDCVRAYSGTQRALCAPFAVQFNSNCSPGCRRRI